MIGAGGDDDGIVKLVNFGHVNVFPDFHISEEANIAAFEDGVEGFDNRADARVVRGNPVANQTVRGGELIEKVNADR
ncbi:hypothetical protein OJ928_11420, partial [Streptococcus anginosus]|nr:hypothetical protein [Streptococcus anginosus]